MTETIGEACEVSVWQLGDDAVPAELQRLDQVVRLAQARMVEVAAKAQQRGLPARAGCRRLAQWVRWVLPAASASDATRVADLAEAFYRSPVAADLAPTREALQAGQVTAAQAAVIATTVTALVPPKVPAGIVGDEVLSQAQALLLTEARSLDPRRLSRVADHLRHRLDPDADERLARDEHAQDQVRGLTLAGTGSGMVHVEGLLTRRCGTALRAAVDAWSAPQPAQDGSPDPRTAAQRRHDGLHRLAEEALARPDLVPTSHGSPYRVVVTVPHETLAAALSERPGQPVQGLQPALLPDGAAISSTTLAQLSCGADLVPVLTDTFGNPLDVGDTQYSFPPKQRLAIAVRDQHCTYSGCSAPPAWCDVHHLQAFSRGGSTSVTNGALLCGRHHRHVHATGLTGQLVDGQVVWTSPAPARPPGDPPSTATTRATRASSAVDHLARRWRARQQR